MYPLAKGPVQAPLWPGPASPSYSRPFAGESRAGDDNSTVWCDLIKSASLAPLWLALGWHDIKQRYRRSVVGPFWITIATVVFVAIMTLLYSALFRDDFWVFLPMTSAGLVAWGFISACITEGARVFIDQSNAIRQLPLPLPIHVLRLLWQQLIIMLHNAVAIVLVAVWLHALPTLNTVLLLPALALLLVNLCWMALLLAIIGARFRDVPIIVSALMPIVFLATPIFWRPTLLPANRAFLVSLNPIADLIEIVRAPALGHAPLEAAWLVCIGAATIGWAITLAAYARCRHRIALWI